LLPFNSEICVFTSAIRTIDLKIEKTIVLPTVLYGYETWLVTYREEHRLSAFENNAEEYWLHLPQDKSKCWTL
jgi:hypothetical protein